MTPILVTGAAGSLGGVGRQIVELLRKKDLPVRAMVHVDDERAERLRSIGAEVVVGDLLNAEDVVKAVKGCKRIYFGLSISPDLLEATMTIAAAAVKEGDVQVFVNMSQMTVSELNIGNLMNASEQQRQHFFAEQALNWSPLPVVHIRPTVYLNHFLFSDWASESIFKDGSVKFPFGEKSKTSPIATEDVADVIANILEAPYNHIGKVYELTGPESLSGEELAKQYTKALDRSIRYEEQELATFNMKLANRGLPAHLYDHLATMARLHADNRYDRKTDDVKRITGRMPMSVEQFVGMHRTDIFHPKS